MLRNTTMLLINGFRYGGSFVTIFSTDGREAIHGHLEEGKNSHRFIQQNWRISFIV